jgi:hypothetical protein
MSPSRCGCWSTAAMSWAGPRTDIVSRVQLLLLEVVPGGAKKFLTRGHASYLLRTALEPVGIVAETRHQLARELIEELTVIDAKILAAGQAPAPVRDNHRQLVDRAQWDRPVRSGSTHR